MASESGATSAPAKEKEWVVFPVTVQWGDMDANMHVNNVMYLKWMEHARIDFIRNSGSGTASDSVEAEKLRAGMESAGIGSTLGAVSCRFRRSVTYPDTCHIRTRIKSIGTTSFTIEQEIESARIGLAASGETQIVFLSTKTGKSIPIPAPIANKIKSKL